LTAVQYGLPRLAGATPSFHSCQPAFKLFVDRKEVFDFSPHMGKNLIHRVDLVIPRIARGYGEHFLIAFFRIHHIQNSYRPNLNETSGETRLLNQN
jgi:hypothetical protein